ERALARFEREVAGCLRILGDVALADAGAFLDPGVAGLDALRGLVVRHDARRQVAAGACDARADHGCAADICCVILRTTSLRTASAARWIAWLNACASAEPWLLMTTPLRPSRL